MQDFTLNNGVKMPALGFGVYQVRDLKQCKQSVLDALSVGYRLIDTAASYYNEEAVGEAIKESGIKREDLFVTSKLWLADSGYDKTKKAFELSLKKLGLEYLDLYLIHQPFGDYYGSWRAMQDLYKERRIRAIGVSNFFPGRLVDLILHNEICPAVNQVENHPFFQQKGAVEIMKKYGVQPQAWAPFAEGRNNLFGNIVLGKIAADHNKSPAQVVLRWLFQRGVASIPKSIHKERMKENFNIFDFTLSNDEMNQIAALDKPASSFLNHEDPQTVEWLCNLH